VPETVLDAIVHVYKVLSGIILGKSGVYEKVDPLHEEIVVLTIEATGFTNCVMVNVLPVQFTVEGVTV
jgi:hypothetical protein